MRLENNPTPVNLVNELVNLVNEITLKRCTLEALKSDIKVRSPVVNLNNFTKN
ncbi:8783_t:CDS:2 [Gigaspora rosea]|nr:8783_t:CDS:2 [Gigaspora rosea]